MSLTQRSVLILEQAIKTEHTRKAYLYWLEKFKGFWHIKDYDSLLTIETKKLQTMLEDYLFVLKKSYSQSTIQTAFAGLELFFAMNDASINFKKIRKMFPPEQKEAGGVAYTTTDIKKMLDVSRSLRSKALIHFLASTGVRLGSIPEIRLEHIKELEPGCKTVKVYDNTKEEYWTFLTPEASKCLDDYLNERKRNGEYLDSKSVLFGTNHNYEKRNRKTAWKHTSIRSLLYDVVDRAGIDRTKDSSTRYSIQIAHGFRKRFNTILKSNNTVNPNLAEKMMGHSSTIQLDNVYFKPTLVRIFEEFQKIIPELTISDSERLRLELEYEKALRKQDSRKDDEVKDLRRRLSDVEKILRSLNSQP